MDVKKILKEYMALEATKLKDGFFQLIFKNHSSSDHNIFEIKSILNQVNLPEKNAYFELLRYGEIKYPHINYLKLDDHILWVNFSNHGKGIMTTDGLRHTNVIKDLKQYKTDYDIWLDDYLTEISPKLQGKVDNLTPKDFDLEDMNIILKGRD